VAPNLEQEARLACAAFSGASETLATSCSSGSTSCTTPDAASSTIPGMLRWPLRAPERERFSVMAGKVL